MIDSYLTYEALFGGGLIGLASVLLYILNGKIAGISGIIGGTLNDPPKKAGWRFAFLAGLIAGGLLTPMLLGKSVVPVINNTWWSLAIAGFLVGFGTRLGSGCTSGHGICGLGRLSKRSLSAVAVFIASGMITVFIIRHL